MVDTAVELLDDAGLDGLSMTGIANEMGVTQPALYRHVDGVDDLWRELGLRGREALADAIGEAVMGRSGADAVRAAASAWRTFANEQSLLYLATDRVPCAGDAELEAAVARVVEILGRALRSFELSDERAEHAARALRSALHGFVHLEIVDGHPLASDLDGSFDALVEMLCSSFARSQEAS